MKLILANSFLVFFLCASAQKKKLNILDSLLSFDTSLNNVAKYPKRYKLQIIYTQINRNSKNSPTFKDYTYKLDSLNYFYPASLVKLPTAIAALEKLNEINNPQVNFNSPMLTDSSNVCQCYYHKDYTAKDNYPSIAQHIKKMFLVSDNNSYSRLFEFVTPIELNKKLNKWGYPTARITHRFDVPCIGKGNRYFNQIRFLNSKNEVVYTQKSDSLLESIKMPFESMIIGHNVYNRKKRLISSEKNFANSNYLSLKAIHVILKKLIFHKYIDKKQQYNITEKDWQLLVSHLGMMPKESESPKYDSKEYYDSYKKYFIYGCSVATINSDSIRIFNIVGRAYGFLIDCAYIINKTENVEFMLSTAMYLNKHNSFGSGIYEFNEIGLPFMKELSLNLYAFEKKRHKKHLPDLNEFNLYPKENDKK
ncbi:MAG: serine hydrolase [Bacteroidetes bacterium]|nr:serine hydrolase [Bacteroidota bacterium]